MKGDVSRSCGMVLFAKKSVAVYFLCILCVFVPDDWFEWNSRMPKKGILPI